MKVSSQEYHSKKNAISLSGKCYHIILDTRSDQSRNGPSGISSAILVLLKELENACEPGFNTMSRTVWSALDLVSGPSLYVDEIVKGVEQVTDVVRSSIEQKKYFRNYLDKAAR